MLVDIDAAFMTVETVQHIDRFFLGGTHGEDVEVTILVGDPGIELAAGVAAVMRIDLAALGTPAAGPEELPVRGRRFSVAPELGERVREMDVDDGGQG